ncbi:CRISPR-associated protein, Cmr4 family [Caloranaerobacter azorensis DSM 13643]|uniref:CRISPR-associated protein, Cmr4 family n=1 Tax=Caloranaerobacter azorensis DSM 13643 TaxID=1121264 RepID=A0A1M5UGX7_9FIRM|nr:type III-B CRISPR module RAMP protein Cmr4 [Caloranaerobacter azorensis]SHH62191.1 CRISPR-associated protein, Cmr4 family [Caloranaerobacter azorensis DSM 13643]
MGKTSIYLIRAITNMHVGSGDTNLGIVDNLVQRDIITGFPVINSSSFKGALREYFERKLQKKDDEIINFIFGTQQEAGKYNFLSAQLLVYPVRSDKKQFFRATTVPILKNFIEQFSLFDVKMNEEIIDSLKELSKIDVNDSNVIIFDEKLKDAVIEDYYGKYVKMDKTVLDNVEKILGRDIAIFSDTNFKEIIENLPVIARNKLENGESKNLWFEEIVPRETKFFIPIIKEDKYSDEFDELITKEMIQIGANSSIGYGLCCINKVGDSNE